MPDTAPLHIEIEKLTIPPCIRCKRLVQPLCNLGVCERCVGVCLDDGWLVPAQRADGRWGDFAWAPGADARQAASRANVSAPHPLSILGRLAEKALSKAVTAAKSPSEIKE